MYNPSSRAMLGNRLTLHQRVIATATVFFRLLHVENLYCETDPFIMIAACCYVAAKAEEFPVHIKNVVSESRVMFGRICASWPYFPHSISVPYCRGWVRGQELPFGQLKARRNGVLSHERPEWGEKPSTPWSQRQEKSASAGRTSPRMWRPSTIESWLRF